jgi:hypothetical protein
MNAQDWEKKTQEVLRDPARYGIRDCLICRNDKITFVGICFPSKELAGRLQTPAGKTRTVFYGLCEECASKEKESADRVEEIIRKELDEGQTINLLSAP